MAVSQESCPFLGLPTELRLLIYEYAILESEVITVGTAELVGKKADIVYWQYADGRAPLPGIPSNHHPMITPTYNANLLSLTKPAVIPLTAATSLSPESRTDTSYQTHQHLLLSNKQIREELTHHFNLPKNRTTKLFMSFPHGLHVMKATAPHLVRQARSVHIAGAYKSQLGGNFYYQRRLVRPHDTNNPCRAGLSEPEKAFLAEKKIATSELAALITALLGPYPTHPVEKVELRVYYPGADSYSCVWSDDSSPIVVALKSIAYGEIDIKVWRGRHGCGVLLTAKPPAALDIDDDAKGRRVVSTIWRRLEEGRRGEPECGSWLVDPSWPDGQADEDDGKADEHVVIS